MLHLQETDFFKKIVIFTLQVIAAEYELPAMFYDSPITTIAK
jgi:hypothetical protein